MDNQPEKFCYIVGSFATTAPVRRTANSNIDIICSENVDESNIRHHLKIKYPNLPNDVPLTIHRKKSVDGIVQYGICYWQKGMRIKLFSNQQIILLATHDPIDLPSVIRDPCKENLVEYLNSAKQLVINCPKKFYDSVNYHYCKTEFSKIILDAKLDDEEILILKYLSIKICDDFESIIIDTEQKLIIDGDKSYNYDEFIAKYLIKN